MGSSLSIGGKVAIITGGSRGLGRAVAEKLCANGCHVIVNYANSDPDAQDTLNSLARLPGSATLVKADVREHRALEAVVNKAIDMHGRLDIFIHNAATLQPMSAFAPDTAAVYREQELALNPLLLGAGIFAKAMNEETGGRVIAISSNGAGHVIPGYLSVGVAKAAMESLVRYLAAELAGKGIAVNAISTALLNKGGPNTSGLASPAVTAMLAARTPAGRLSTPADVADAIALLCAPEAAWIHGQVITVDGGLGLLA
jgi:enoyl-[acyl-carrier protein] reductase III